MRKSIIIPVIGLLILLFISIPVKSIEQDTASFGIVNTSLSTTSAGAVNGTAFSLPAGAASVISWQMTYSMPPSAVDIAIQASLDNSNWFTIQTSSNTSGDLQNISFSAYKFVRIIQNSRTGGTSSLGIFTVQRGPLANSGTYAFVNGSASVPSVFPLSAPTLGLWYAPIADTYAINVNGGALNIPDGYVLAESGLIGSEIFLTNFSKPSAPTVTPTCSGTCATTYGYKVQAFSYIGHSVPSNETTTAVQAASLDSTHYNTITWTSVNGAREYKVYRTTGGATSGVISNICCGSNLTLSIIDNGQDGDSQAPVNTTTTGKITTSVGTGPTYYTIGTGIAGQSLTSVTDAAVQNQWNVDSISINQPWTYLVAGETFKYEFSWRTATNGNTKEFQAWFAPTTATCSGTGASLCNSGCQLVGNTTIGSAIGVKFEAVFVRDSANNQKGWQETKVNGSTISGNTVTCTITETANAKFVYGVRNTSASATSINGSFGQLWFTAK